MLLSELAFKLAAMRGSFRIVACSDEMHISNSEKHAESPRSSACGLTARWAEAAWTEELGLVASLSG